MRLGVRVRTMPEYSGDKTDLQITVQKSTTSVGRISPDSTGLPWPYNLAFSVSPFPTGAAPGPAPADASHTLRISLNACAI
jgi:hypothetical protein